MKEGILTAADIVKAETGEPQCNVVGYCVAGTLLSATLAYLAKTDQAPFTSATFLTTQTDFTKAGDLTLLIGNEQLKAIEARCPRAAEATCRPKCGDGLQQGDEQCDGADLTGASR